MRRLGLAVLGVLAAAGATRAEVVDKGPSHFRLKITQQVAAPPDRVYAALGEIGRWWDDAHTYSGKAANMTMPLTANACFCEALPGGGGVRHGVVEAVTPRQMVRVSAALGPLQDEGVAAALTFHLKPKDGGTELVTTYHVGGARDFVVSMAPGIDAVLTAATVRLKAYADKP